MPLQHNLYQSLSSKPQSAQSISEQGTEGGDTCNKQEDGHRALKPTSPSQSSFRLLGSSPQHNKPGLFVIGNSKTSPLSNTTTAPIPRQDNMGITPASELGNPETPESPGQNGRSLTSRDSGIKRVVSGLFHRSHSQSLGGARQAAAEIEKPVFAILHRRIPGRGTSATNFPAANQYVNDHSRKMNEPLPFDPVQQPLMIGSIDGNIEGRSLPRLQSRLSTTEHKVVFNHPPKESQNGNNSSCYRFTSANSNNTAASIPSSQALLPPRQVWGMAANTGVGVKSRRLSLSFPDNFTVDVVNLYSEFADQSKLIGRRGKSIGKGATAHVRLMNKKGGYPGEVYAVKEFRGKSSKEKQEDYEKKVKSEYSIAKSVHHPNIVKTIRLCTYNGRWNHVMEFCDQGDLFSLVSQKYLSKGDHLIDRLCLFKQLLQGLNYLHTHGIAHRDVKLENILVTRDSKLKITDFGVSEVFCGIHPGLRSAGGQCGKDMGEIRLCDPGMCGSPPYVAPEVVEKKDKYDPRPLDVWGAAVVMLCMAANGCLWQEARIGNSPLYDDLIQGWVKWNAKHGDDDKVAVSEMDYPHVAFFDHHINPPALRRILLTMLNPDPSKRASIATIARNRWMKNVECCQMDGYDSPGSTIDASQSDSTRKLTKIVQHNHLPPSNHLGHHLVRLPWSSDV